MDESKNPPLTAKQKGKGKAEAGETLRWDDIGPELLGWNSNLKSLAVSSQGYVARTMPPISGPNSAPSTVLVSHIGSAGASQGVPLPVPPSVSAQAHSSLSVLEFSQCGFYLVGFFPLISVPGVGELSFKAGAGGEVVLWEMSRDTSPATTTEATALPSTQSWTIAHSSHFSSSVLSFLFFPSLREWTSDFPNLASEGSIPKLSRLSHAGPYLPLSSPRNSPPTFLSISDNHQVTLFYKTQLLNQGWREVKCSVESPTVAVYGMDSASKSTGTRASIGSGGSGYRRRVKKAAWGLRGDDPTVYLLLQSGAQPATNTFLASANPLNTTTNSEVAATLAGLGLGMDISFESMNPGAGTSAGSDAVQPTASSATSAYGFTGTSLEQYVEVIAVTVDLLIGSEGEASITTRPLAPLYFPVASDEGTDAQGEVIGSDGILTHLNFVDLGLVKGMVSDEGEGDFGVVGTFVHPPTDPISSLPHSSIHLWTVEKKPLLLVDAFKALNPMTVTEDKEEKEWFPSLTCSRVYENSVINCITPTSGSNHGLLLVADLNFDRESGDAGALSVLNLTTLQDAFGWGFTTLKKIQAPGKMELAISPNDSTVYVLGSRRPAGLRVYSHPKYLSPDNHFSEDSSSSKTKSLSTNHLGLLLALSQVKNTDYSDVILSIRALLASRSSSSTPKGKVVDEVIQRAWAVLDSIDGGGEGGGESEWIGSLMEVQVALFSVLQDARMPLAQLTLQLASCLLSFSENEIFTDGAASQTAYRDESTSQLAGQSIWAIELIEDIISWINIYNAEQAWKHDKRKKLRTENDFEASDAAEEEPVPTFLLLLVHPTIRTLISDILESIGKFQKWLAEKPDAHSGAVKSIRMRLSQAMLSHSISIDWMVTTLARLGELNDHRAEGYGQAATIGVDFTQALLHLKFEPSLELLGQTGLKIFGHVKVPAVSQPLLALRGVDTRKRKFWLSC